MPGTKHRASPAANSGLRQREYRSGHKGRLGNRPTQAQRHRLDRPRCTRARSIESKRMLALVGRMDSHLVGQHGQVAEESDRRYHGLDHRSPLVSITFQRHILEIQRFVASPRCFPGKRRVDKEPRREALIPKWTRHGYPPRFGNVDLVRIAEQALKVGDPLAIALLDDDRAVDQVHESAFGNMLALRTSPRPVLRLLDKVFFGQRPRSICRLVALDKLRR